MPEKGIRITVVIPAFNREKTILKCLESAVNQTYEPQEVLVIDDGSSDHTRELVLTFTSDKVRLLCQEHKGAQAARNAGIKNAKGNYIAFLDSDDEWVCDKLEKQAAVLKEKPDAVVYTNCYVVRGAARSVWNTPGTSGRVYEELLQHPGPMFQGMTVSRKALADVGLLDEKVPAYQEWDTSIRLAEKYEMIHMEEPLFYYNLHDGETISKNGTKDIEGYEYVVNKHRKKMIETAGYKAMLSHYHLLIKKCIQYKNRKLYRYIWRYYRTGLVMKIRGERV